MKRNSQSNLLSLPLLSAALGLAVTALRSGLYTMGLDEKNLLTALHPLEILVWVVTAAALGVMILRALPLSGSNRWEDNFRPNALAAAGCFALAAAIALVQLPMLGSSVSVLEKLCSAMGIVSIPGMIWTGICRLRGKKPFFGCHAALCVYLSLYLLGQYRLWSGNPQLQDYVFAMLACVCLALYAYQQAAFDVDAGSRRRLLVFGLLGGFFGFASLWGAEHWTLYAAGAVWSLTNLCRLSPVSRYLRDDPEEP